MNLCDLMNDYVTLSCEDVDPKLIGSMKSKFFLTIVAGTRLSNFVNA